MAGPSPDARGSALDALHRLDPGATLDAPALRRSLGLESDYLAGRILARFDADGDGVLKVGELAWRLRALLDGPPEERVRFAFALHDHDNDGALSRDEVTRMVHLSLAESGLQLPPRTADALVSALLRRADQDLDGHISLAEFTAVAEAHAPMREAIARGALHLLGRSLRGPAAPSLTLRERWQLAWPTWLFVSLYALSSVGMLLAGALTYRARGANGYVQLARACGWAMDVQLGWILVPALRGVLTRLRRSVIGPLLPLDDAWSLHRAAAIALLALAGVHTLAHAGNLAALGVSPLDALARTPVWTGVAWLLVFAVMLWFARESVRRSGHFERFARSHLLYIPWIALAFAHAPGPRPWMALPVALFALERWRRARRRSYATQTVLLEPLASGVTLVVLARPEGFAFEAGEYLYLRVPALARSEWHPFTISSHPERADLLTVHVRSLGNWTAALHAIALRRKGIGDDTPLVAELDGPYGAPASEVFRAEVAVLVGAGIGVTPFASVLASLLARSQGEGAGLGTVKRVYFVWVARDQFAFEWFADLLRGIEEKDTRGLFDLRMWITSARADTAASTLGVALDLLAARTGRDPVTGLRTRTRFGPPDWDALFDEIRRANPEAQTGVFFCGPHGLAPTLRRAAASRAMRFHEEQF